MKNGYDEKLIAAIKARGFCGNPIYRDGNTGGIYFSWHGFPVYCTPGYEGDWSGLPIELHVLETDERVDDVLPVDFTGDLRQDVELWTNAVADWIQSVRYDAARW